MDIRQVQLVKVNGRKCRYAELLGTDPKYPEIKAAIEDDTNPLTADYLISDGMLHYCIEQRRS